MANAIANDPGPAQVFAKKDILPDLTATPAIQDLGQSYKKFRLTVYNKTVTAGAVSVDLRVGPDSALATVCSVALIGWTAVASVPAMYVATGAYPLTAGARYYRPIITGTGTFDIIVEAAS